MRPSRGFEVRCFQTNHEGRLVEQLHALARGDEPVDAILINPGAWTHYSWALHDALELVVCPVAEVHLSAIEEREQWRRRSVIADLAAIRVSGKGIDGYLEAVDKLAEDCRPVNDRLAALRRLLVDRGLDAALVADRGRRALSVGVSRRRGAPGRRAASRR